MILNRSDSAKPYRPCAIVIPVYNHEGRVRETVKAAARLGFPVFVVDDGSTDSTFARIKDIRRIQILRHSVNLGKGAAILTGFSEAAKIADRAVTIDADGQHDPAEIPALIGAALNAGGRPIVVGMREGMIGPDVPWTSRFGRKFSNFWVRISGGPILADSQSGFRLYPLPETLHLPVKARRFQFEVEILVRARRARIPVIEVPVSVCYRPGGERISHFRPFVDFCRNSATFARLITGRIFLRNRIGK